MARASEYVCEYRMDMMIQRYLKTKEDTQVVISHLDVSVVDSVLGYIRGHACA